MSAVSLARKLFRQAQSRSLSGVSLVKLRLNPPTARQLEIGSGPVQKAGWVTLDMCRGADVIWDLHDSLPFADESFERVYCSHVLEHFYYPDMCRLLKQVFRVLRPGGQFLIAVPDASLYVGAYVAKSNASELLRYGPAVISHRPMDILNYIFYMENHHRFMFDQDNLAHHCREAGFEACTPRAFDPSVDSAERDYESLYMICSKPVTA